MANLIYFKINYIRFTLPPSTVFWSISFGLPYIKTLPPALTLASTNSEAFTRASPAALIETSVDFVFKSFPSNCPPV